MAKYNDQPSPVRKVWKTELYKLQLDAPTPKPLICVIDVLDSPYENVFHGKLSHQESERLLSGTPDGTFLIRQSANAVDFSTLSVQFDRQVKHYKIYYSATDGHYQKKADFKYFDTVNELVADGLLTFFMQMHGAKIIQEMMCQTEQSYQSSPYYTLNKRKLRALSHDLRTSSTANGNYGILDNGRRDDVLVIPVDLEEPLPQVYEKKHKFKVNNFKGLNWCELCANYLWGFKAQGVKCEDCGFVAHNKCSELVPAKCVPDLKRIRGIFGTDITTLVTVHKCTIPFIVRKCVEEVESRGMLQEGIYRVSGFADEIDALKLSLDKEGEKANMSESAYSNINVISGIMKLYLRLLPLPLITHQAYPAFMGAMKCPSEGEQLIAMREAMKLLPPAHYNTLKFIIEHLSKVTSHHAVNKMTEYNLGTVFAPTLIAIPLGLTDLSQEIHLLASMIQNCRAVFL